MSTIHGWSTRQSPMVGRRGTRPTTAAPLVGGMVSMVVLLSACGAQGYGTAAATAAATATPSPAAVESHGTDPGPTGATDERPRLPTGFPVPSGAISEPLPPDDLTLVARWMLDAVGSGPYDYYLEALPAAGYAVVGRYPADQAALVRFEVSPGTVWQLVLEHLEGRTRVTVQTDRP